MKVDCLDFLKLVEGVSPSTLAWEHVLAAAAALSSRSGRRRRRRRAPCWVDDTMAVGASIGSAAVVQHTAVSSAPKTMHSTHVNMSAGRVLSLTHKFVSVHSRALRSIEYTGYAINKPCLRHISFVISVMHASSHTASQASDRCGRGH